MKLTRKDVKDPIAVPQSVVISSGGEKLPEGVLAIPVEIARACYFALLPSGLLQEMARQAGFQPAGFRINKMKPPELFVQLVRYVQKEGLGAAPIVEMVDDEAFALAQDDPEVFKAKILEPPFTLAIDAPEAACWAAATWIKVRSGELDQASILKIAETCRNWLQEPVPVLRTDDFADRLPPDGSQVKIKEKLRGWRERALDAEKSLESARSARNAFEKEFREAREETRSLREEVARLLGELAGRTAAQKHAEEKCANLQASLKEAQKRLSSFEEELARERKREGIEAGPTPRADEPTLLALQEKIDRLQKAVEILSGRLSEALAAPAARAPLVSRGSERVMAFLDVANLDWAANTYFGRRVDYEMLARFISSRTPTGHARHCEKVAFVCVDRRTGVETFPQLLRSLGYRTVTRPLKVYADGNTKGNVDVQLAVYAVKHIDDFDTAVIVSGDGDFAALAEFLKSRGKRVEVLSFQNLGSEMRAVADELVPLDERVLLPSAQQELFWTGQR